MNRRMVAKFNKKNKEELKRAKTHLSRAHAKGWGTWVFRTVRERRRFTTNQNHATSFIPQPFFNGKKNNNSDFAMMLPWEHSGDPKGNHGSVRQTRNVPSNAIALGERLALWHQITPYVVGWIYADVRET